MKYLSLLLFSLVLITTGCKKHVKKSLAVLTTSPVMVKANVAESGGTIVDDGGSPITQRGICWAEHSDATISDSITKDGTGEGAFTSSFSRLKGNTEYYIRAYAINSSGTAYGNEVTFKTDVSTVAYDIDGNAYDYLYFCDKLITRQNLKTTHYKNGDPIVNGLTGFDWATAVDGAYTFPNGDVETKENHGLLYNIQAVNDERNMCPAGWHVATDQDWKDFEVCFGEMEQIVADKTGWRHFIGRAVVDQLQYPGFLSNADGTFHEFNREGLYWTSTPSGSEGNWIRKYAPFNGDDYPALWRNPARDSTMSVRCVKAYEGEFD